MLISESSLNFMNEPFDQVLELAQKLTSPMVVYDKQGGKHLVILGIDEFAHYLDSGKKTPVGPVAPVNTNLSQAPEVRAESAMDESIFEPQVEVGEAAEAEVQTWAENLPPELSPQNEATVGEHESREIEAEIKKTPLVPSAAVTSQHWHRLGDVIRRVHPEISVENTPKPVPYRTSSEPVSEADEPSFLEEPTP